MARKGTTSLRRKKRQGPSLFEQHQGILLPFLVVGLILLLAVIGLIYEFYSTSNASLNSSKSSSLLRSGASGGTFERPIAPPMPLFAPVPNAEDVMEETLSGKPSMAGVMAIMQKFMFDLHMTNRELSSSKAKPQKIIATIFDLIKRELGAFDEVYRDRLVFPVREDGSVFLSLAAYREHLLNDTMAFAFDSALHPEKLYVGAVVQNCFGKVLDDGVTIDTSGLPCRR